MKAKFVLELSEREQIVIRKQRGKVRDFCLTHNEKKINRVCFECEAEAEQIEQERRAERRNEQALYGPW